MKKIVKLGVILLLGLIALEMPVFALTRVEIKAEVRYCVRDTTSTVNNPRWSDDCLNNRVNIVQKEIALITNALKGRCLITPIAETQEYRMPNDLATIDRVSFFVSGSTTAYKKLESVSMYALDRDIANWENMGSGLPRQYYERRNYIGLYPKPSSTYATSQALKIDYYKKPDDLILDTSEPWDGDYSLRAYHNLIVLGVSILCKKDEGNITEMQSLQSEYNVMLNLMKQYIATKPDEQQKIKIPTK